MRWVVSSLEASHRQQLRSPYGISIPPLPSVNRYKYRCFQRLHSRNLVFGIGGASTPEFSLKGPVALKHRYFRRAHSRNLPSALEFRSFQRSSFQSTRWRQRYFNTSETVAAFGRTWRFERFSDRPFQRTAPSRRYLNCGGGDRTYNPLCSTVVFKQRPVF